MGDRDCLRCAFFQPDPERPRSAPNAAIVGECRRHSPAPRLGNDGQHSDYEMAVWPRVWAGAWCGEFQAIELTPNGVQAVAQTSNMGNANERL